MVLMKYLIEAKDIIINAYVPSKLITYNLFKDICP